MNSFIAQQHHIGIVVVVLRHSCILWLAKISTSVFSFSPPLRILLSSPV